MIYWFGNKITDFNLQTIQSRYNRAVTEQQIIIDSQGNENKIKDNLIAALYEEADVIRSTNSSIVLQYNQLKL